MSARIPLLPDADAGMAATMSNISAVAVVAAAASLALSPLAADPARAAACSPGLTQELLQPAALAGDTFGRSVALDDGVLVVGSPAGDGFETPTVPDAGVITMFHQDSAGAWVADGQFSNPRDHAYMNFGEHVEVSGDFAITQASHYTPIGVKYGIVCVYGYNGSAWAFADSLAPMDTTQTTFFGDHLAIDGDHMAIWEAGSALPGNDRVHAYFYDGAQWGPDTTLSNPDGDSNDEFGTDVAISGDLMVVGSPNWGPGVLTEAGAIHIFRHDGNGWTFEQRVDFPGAKKGLNYGTHVAIDGNTIAVSCSQYSINPNQYEGAVFVVEWDGAQWTNTAMLTASDAAPYDQIGEVVDVDGDMILVGAPFTGLNPTDSGAAYVYQRPEGGWVDKTEDAKLTPAVTGQYNQYGWDGGIVGETVVIGDFGNDEISQNGGKCWVYDLGCGGGVTGAPLAAAAGPALLEAWPNPFRAGGGAVRLTVPGDRTADVTVHDVRGARVRSFRGAEWDGRGDGGAPLPAGHYFLRARAGGWHATGRVVLVR